MSKTVLVTGGTGYIGSWCVADLLKRGYKVRTTVRSLAKEQAVRSFIAKVADPADNLSFAVADLTQDAGWDAAVEGCAYVLHVASPLASVDNVKDPDEVVRPARDGTLRVLRAATRAGVERVVVTSSAAACRPPQKSADGVSDESVWTDPAQKDLDPYRLSKTLAERAAWDYMATQPGPTTLTTILPSGVLGPVLTTETLGSVRIVQRLLNGSVPRYPRFGFNVVDVRDVVDLHIRAMTAPEAAGERLIATGEWRWMEEMSEILHAELGSRAARVPTKSMPDFVVRLASLFDRQLTFVTPILGRKHAVTSAKAERLFGWKSRSSTATIVDCAESLIAAGVVG